MGFRQLGFADDRVRAKKWNDMEDKLTGNSSHSNFNDQEKEEISGESEVDATIDIKDNGEGSLIEEMKKANKNAIKENRTGKVNWWTRNKGQICDALLILGVIYVGYKLFWEKDDGEMRFDSGGMASAPAPTPVAPAPVAAPVAPPPPMATPIASEGGTI